MKKAVDCPYFYADYFRGRDVEKCRLIERNPHNQRRWHRSLCNSCPVPGILRESTCEHLALEASVERQFLVLERVSVYAVCTEHLGELVDPKRCAQCEEDRRRRETAESPA